MSFFQSTSAVNSSASIHHANRPRPSLPNDQPYLLHNPADPYTCIRPPNIIADRPTLPLPSLPSSGLKCASPLLCHRLKLTPLARHRCPHIHHHHTLLLPHRHHTNPFLPLLTLLSSWPLLHHSTKQPAFTPPKVARFYQYIRIHALTALNTRGTPSDLMARMGVTLIVQWSCLYC